MTLPPVYQDHPHVYRPGEHARFEGREIEILDVIPSGLRLFYRAVDVDTDRELYLRPAQIRPLAAPGGQP